MMVHPLTEAAAMKVVVGISNEPDVKKQIFTSGFLPLKSSSEFEVWKAPLQKILASKLPKCYPKLLLGIIPKSIHYIGLEMLKWAKFHNFHFKLRLKFCQGFIKSSYFTAKGTIDREFTARDLMKEKRLKTFTKYKIACHYFLIDVIPTLRQQLMENKSKFEEDLNNVSQESVKIWTEYLEDKEKFTTERELTQITNRFLFKAFRYGCEKANISAVKYCYYSDKPLKYDFIEETGINMTRFSAFSVNWPVILASRKLRFRRFYFPKKLGRHSDILAFFLNNMKKEDIENFLTSFHMTLIGFQCLLHFPHQELFLKTSDFLFSQNAYGYYYDLLKKIIELIEDPVFGETYNYRDLLSNLWIKSPTHFKEKVILVESHLLRHHLIHQTTYEKDPGYFPLLKMLFILKNFTPDDEYNVDLILESASLENKIKIFAFQGPDTCEILLRRENFNLAKIYVDKFCLPEVVKKTFKKDLAFKRFNPDVVISGKIDLAAEYFNWAASGERVEDLKAEYFHDVFNKKDLAVRAYLRYGRSFAFLNEILKFFLVSDEGVDNWKRKVHFGTGFLKDYFLQQFSYPEGLEQFLDWLNFSEEKKMRVKEKMLHQGIGSAIFTMNYIESVYLQGNKKEKLHLKDIVHYLCSYNNEKINEYIKALSSWCSGNDFPRNFCSFCQNSDHIYRNSSGLFTCRRHGKVNIYNDEDHKRYAKCVKKYLKLFKVGQNINGNGTKRKETEDCDTNKHKKLKLN